MSSKQGVGSWSSDVCSHDHKCREASCTDRTISPGQLCLVQGIQRSELYIHLTPELFSNQVYCCHQCLVPQIFSTPPVVTWVFCSWNDFLSRYHCTITMVPAVTAVPGSAHHRLHSNENERKLF